jgi:NAD(P)-dependent dehydrogenase (short-subunit alcohol dehydrogenase family)
MGRLEGKRCLIVGGTSGIGLAALQRFLQEGARVFVIGLPPTEAAIASQQRWGQEAALATADASDPKAFAEAFLAGSNFLQGLDILFHVAGMSGRRLGDGPLHECTLEGWQATLHANLGSTFLSNQAAIRLFLDRKQPGVILNTASVLAFRPSPQHFDTVAYTAAKAGIIALSQLAAARYAALGIRVNVIAPGLIDTPMATRACQDPAIQAFLATKQPLAHGPGRPEDCSDAAVFLCSDEARFITGVVLPVDGGWCVSEGQYGAKP